eukprot:CAMPEP_0194096130 /NCGR_PEP_ID=MMETSP0149-20130528/57183_1 /TAXON_ID=122233 /ORGANISM="Chaetoceros debilis, Strain MM31A-1" /LENGTH=1139 /DNA_ID=CAMNT_0038782097 /DNA_START=91 /DNA_END=3507 /DNA_ORIENTATION=+
MKLLLLCAGLLALVFGYYEIEYNAKFESSNSGDGGNNEVRAGIRKGQVQYPDRSLETNSNVFPSTTSPDSSWRFLVIADIHGMTAFSYGNLTHNQETNAWNEQLRVLSQINNDYGGELVVLPGDVSSYGGVELEDLIEDLGGNLSPEEAVYQAGRNCFNGTREIFQHAGYDTVIASVGDHEIGGNEGFRPFGKKSKLHTLPNARLAFGDGFNRDGEGEFIFHQPLFGNIPSRPFGTPYTNTSFAHVHKNALFVTVDAFELVGDGLYDYIDVEHGFGGEGAVTCTVNGDGKHINWFKRVLRAARNDPSVDHIIVSAHLPIMQPARKVKCSGQFLDAGEDSDFWKLMNKFNVDLYLAGEVHANTATKTRYPGSNLIQIVTRGNRFNNFLTVDIEDDLIEVKIYNEVGDLSRWNAQYEEAGIVTIDKSSSITDISSSGMLELLDVDSDIISFDFEEKEPIDKTQVLGLRGSESLIATNVTIRGILCEESIPNIGAFGAQYNAQVGNIALVEGRNGGHAAKFHANSRMGIYGIGPFSAGESISFGFWFKTYQSKRKMVLLHYANYWGKVVDSSDKNYFSLALDNGIPVIHTRLSTELKALKTQNLADGKWHHIAVSMPQKSCLVSELEMYVDGILVNTIVDNDHHIFQTTSGRLNIGGFGYSNAGFEDIYPRANPFEGKIDDFSLFARPINIDIDFFPSTVPTTSPTSSPTPSPTAAPTAFPSAYPTDSPTTTMAPTQAPTKTPTKAPTKTPTKAPTKAPTSAPTKEPTSVPTKEPTKSPTKRPTALPTALHTTSPSDIFSPLPSVSLSASPSGVLSAPPSVFSSASPSNIFSAPPSTSPFPSAYPTDSPTTTMAPTQAPTKTPTKAPTKAPTSAPTKEPTSVPTKEPTKSPTKRPTALPTALHTTSPSDIFSPLPSVSLSASPSGVLSAPPSVLSSASPSNIFSAPPSTSPSDMISSLPSTLPTTTPSSSFTMIPTQVPTQFPTNVPTQALTQAPTKIPTKVPTKAPTKLPTSAPTKLPTKVPTKVPTKIPTKVPTKVPTKAPVRVLTKVPTKVPTKAPAKVLTKVPTKAPAKVPTKAPTSRPTNDPTKATKAPVEDNERSNRSLTTVPTIRPLDPSNRSQFEAPTDPATKTPTSEAQARPL